MAVTRSKICFLLLLNLIFENKVLSHALYSISPPDPESAPRNSNFSPDLLKSLKSRLNTFGTVNLNKSPEDDNESNEAPEHETEPEPVETTESFEHKEAHQASESPDLPVSEEPKDEAAPSGFRPTEQTSSYLEKLLNEKEKPVYAGTYAPKDRETNPTTNFDNFLTKHKREMLERCTKTPHEFVVIVDESGSISTYNWMSKVKDFVLLISSAVAQFNTANKLSIVQYSHSPKMVMEPTVIDKLTLAEASKIIDGMFAAPRTHGTTYTGSALEFARTKILDPQGEFVLELSESTAPAAKKNKIIILFTDGGSKDPEKALKESLIHRFNGVDLFVFGIGSFNEAECRKLVGCSPEGNCNYFFHARWETVLEYLQKLVVSMCRDTGRNATCLERWSEFSPCSAKCGGGIKKATLLNVHTVAEATVGEDGIKGLTCEEQFRNVTTRYERCNTFPCSDHLVNINQHTAHPVRPSHAHTEVFDPEESKLRSAPDPLEGEEVSGGMRTVRYGKKSTYEELPSYDFGSSYNFTPEETIVKEETQKLFTQGSPSEAEHRRDERLSHRDERPAPRQEQRSAPTREEVPPPRVEVHSPPTREEVPTQVHEAPGPREDRPLFNTEFRSPSVEQRAAEERAESRDERDSRRLTEVLREIEGGHDLKHVNTEHPVAEHHSQPPRPRHAAPARENTHTHQTTHTATDEDRHTPDLTNLGEFDAPGRVPFHFINKDQHNGVRVERVLDQDEADKLSEREHIRPANFRSTQWAAREEAQSLPSEEEDDLTDMEDEGPATREFSTNTERFTSDSSTNTDRNLADSSTNTERFTSDSSTNTERFTADSSTNTERSTADSSTNTERFSADASTNTLNMADAGTSTVRTSDASTSTEPVTEISKENIKKHVPKYRRVIDHNQHHSHASDFKAATEHAQNFLTTTKMRFKKFFENDHVRKIAAVAIVIFLSALSIWVFSHMFLREKEPTPHLFDPSDHEFMNAGDGDDVEPSENYQVSNMEDGIWA